MESELLLTNIKKYVQLTAGDEQVILSYTTQRSFKRGQFICSEGEVNRYTNFIINGSARVFYIDNNGNEHVIQLAIRDWWISDFSSFTMQQPGLLYCEALEPTEIIALSYDHLHELFDKVPIMERFYRMLIQKAYSSFQKRVLESLSLDAEQRYTTFRTTYPLMDQSHSQKDIASYLGISAEFLSKIKKRIVLKAQNKLK